MLLLDQDRSRWDPLLIRRGLAALERCAGVGRRAVGLMRCRARWRLAMRARVARKTPTGRRSSRCMTRLSMVAPSPVVELNRAVAVGMAFGPAAGLEIVEALAIECRLANYHWLPSVRGDLLAKLGRHEEARAEFERAAGMTRNARERELLLERAAEMKGKGA